MPDIHIPTLIRADARQIPLADGSVQCVVTSPPYWNLRKYDGAQDGIWGGSPECEHRWGEEKKVRQAPSGTTHGAAGSPTLAAPRRHGREWRSRLRQGSFCAECGAWKGSYGFEPTAAMYVEHTVEILREVRRTLRSDGVVFWNMGDSYVNKSLALVPDRVAIAAQEDGWFVRSEIIWVKPDAMPRSVKDRLTDAHERILMLTKSTRYCWNADALREPARTKDCATDGKRNGRNVWEMCVSRYKGAHFATFPEELPRRCILAGEPTGRLGPRSLRRLGHDRQGGDGTGTPQRLARHQLHGRRRRLRRAGAAEVPKGDQRKCDSGARTGSRRKNLRNPGRSATVTVTVRARVSRF